MKPTESNEPYEAWLARRREDFNAVDLSYLVMASVRPLDVRKHATRTSRFLDAPSTLVGWARLTVILLLLLAPA